MCRFFSPELFLFLALTTVSRLLVSAGCRSQRRLRCAVFASGWVGGSVWTRPSSPNCSYSQALRQRQEADSF